MSSLDLRTQVADELEELSKSGAPLNVGAPGATWRLHAVSGTNPYMTRYSASRVRLHRELVEEFMSENVGLVREGRVALVTAGPPGVGKSTKLDRLGFDSTTWRRIDPDHFKTRLIRRDLQTGVLALPKDLEARRLADCRTIMPMELSGLYHYESTVLADRARALSLSVRENVIVEGTLSWGEVVAQLVSEFSANGYHRVDVVLVDVAMETALAQAVSRWWEARGQGGMGGRFTPAATIRAMYGADRKSVCVDNAENLVFSARAADLEAGLL